MKDHNLIYDPEMFAVWAHVDPSKLLRAAEHLASASTLSVPQGYQVAKQSVAEQKRIMVWDFVWYWDAKRLAMDLPLGFLTSSAVIAQDSADPASSAFCEAHGCFYFRKCGVCNNDHLPLP